MATFLIITGLTFIILSRLSTLIGVILLTIGLILLIIELSTQTTLPAELIPFS